MENIEVLKAKIAEQAAHIEQMKASGIAMLESETSKTRIILKMREDAAALTKQLAEAKKDQERLDWLEARCVEVRKPLRHGSLALFHAQMISDDDAPYKTDLRQAVDKAIQEAKQ